MLEETLWLIQILRAAPLAVLIGAVVGQHMFGSPKVKLERPGTPSALAAPE